MKKLTIFIEDACFTNKHLAYCKQRHQEGIDQINIQLLMDAFVMVELFHLECENETYITLDSLKGSEDIRLSLGFKFKDLSEKGRDYALKHRLFIEDMVSKEMNDKRLHHTLEVAKLAQELAIIHHLDGNKAYLMGLLHDVSKQWDKKLQLELMKQYFALFLDEPKALYHQHTALIWIDEHLGELDSYLLDAIAHHGSGDLIEPYAMILFIADKIEPTRGYDVKEALALSKQDLKQGFDMVKEYQQTFLKVRGIV
ncbi:MAG: bis(5'-nucleosyl)-tetraphosphatase (symmetrical) YqeK [Erysipelotrichaceae bacterium]